MRAWVFRNRRRLEVVYGAPGRARHLAAPPGEESPRSAPRGGPAAATGPRLLAYEMIPASPRFLRRAG
ncbi:MAG: hypothetical protein AB1726_06475 [Planctomycetota bacterium]